LGTQSPGDVWTWTIGESTFSASNETSGYWYSGTYTTLSSGFLKLVYTSSNDPGCPTDGTGIAYAMEVPNTALLVKPGTYAKVVLCAAKATTAPSAGYYNWVIVPWTSWTTALPAYGTVEVTKSNDLYTFYNRTYDLNQNFVSYEVYTGFSFGNGKLTKAGNNLQVFMTPSGMYAGDQGTGVGGFFGAQKQVVSLSDVANKEYRGVLFKYYTSTGTGETQPIGATPHPTVSGAIKGFDYSDIEQNTINPASIATLEFGSQNASGIVSGTLKEPNGTNNTFHMVISQINNKYVVLGISTSNNLPYNFLVLEK
jgi:hypothetical protein